MSNIRNLFEGKKGDKANGKMLKGLHELDDRIENFIDGLEEKINDVQDNPVFIKKAHQLLADMSKEYSEFIMALRAIVNAVDRRGQVLPNIDSYESIPRDVNSNAGQEEIPENNPPPEESGGDGGGDDDEEFELKVAKKKKGGKKKKSSVKEALEG